jgi:tRNA threonylcarbamoyladenosine biosynthesis protein TsaB
VKNTGIEMNPRLLLLETSHQPGVVALAESGTLVGEVRLDEARRHTRDLVPAAKTLLERAGWTPRELHGVVVSIGPGSYTGLRVGIMSAKTLAYVTGCALIGLETFAAIARQTPAEASRLAVLADGQQDKIYVQHFSRTANGWVADGDLAIRPFAEWVATCSPETWVSGPGLEAFRDRLPLGQPVAARTDWTPRAESLLALGLAAYHAGRRDDPFAIEPLYLRPSAAEENWAKRRSAGVN